MSSLLLLVIFGFYFPSEKYCSSAECVRSAAIIRTALNMTVNPCENFYEYTCGRWNREHPLYPGHELNSKFTKISDRVFARVLKFLSTENNSDIDPVRQSRMFYKSCLDKESREVMAFTAIHEYLEIIGIPKIPTILFPDGQQTELQLDWIKLETKMKKIFFMDIFIGFRIQVNPLNVLENFIYIGRPFHKCPILRPYSDNYRDKSWRIIIKYIIHQFLKNATNEVPTENIIEEATKVIVEMSSKVEGFKFPPDNNYHHKYSFGELQDEIDFYTTEKCNRTFPKFLKKYVNNILEGTINNATDLEQTSLYINAGQKTYLLYILAYLLEKPDIHIELYLWWSAVVCMVMNSSLVVRNFILDQIDIPARDPIRNANRISKRFCLNEVVQNMGFVVAYGIANETFSTENGLKIKTMVEELREAFTESIGQISWMDNKGKAAILEKSKNMYTFIGFPEWLFVEGELEKYYKGMKMNSTTYMHNIMEIVKRLSNDMLEQSLAANRSDIKREFPVNPITVNAFNMFCTNSIIIPLAIVTFPLYHLGLEVLNYGTMGAILGHELIHGFDRDGWKYDKHGSNRKWLSTNLIHIFEQKSVCFKNQYDNATIEGIKGKVSGDLTLGENIADNGGLKHALTAYRNSRKRLGREAKLPGFENFSNEQMFFIAYAGIWCQTISPRQVEHLMKYDRHSPSPVRVNMAVSNSEDFAKAFSCPKGTKMNPVKKCKLW